MFRLIARANRSHADRAPITPGLGRLLLLAGVGVMVIGELTLGAQHPLTRFGINLLAGAACSSVVMHRRAGPTAIANVRTLALAVLYGVIVAAAARLLAVDWLLAAAVPALLQLTLAALVGRTLLPGKVPAIRRIAAALNSDAALPPDIDVYTRTVTWVWVMTFIALAVGNLVWLAQHGAAPVISGVIDAVVITAVIVFEFCYRKHRYADYPLSSFAEFWRGLRRLDPYAILS